MSAANVKARNAPAGAKVQLLVAGGGPEVVALHDVFLGGGLAVFAHDHRAALLAEGRIGQHHVEALAGVGGQRVGHTHRHALLGADAMKHQVHRAHARRALHQLPAAEGAVFQLALLVAGEVGEVVRQVLMRGEQKAAGAAGRVADHLARPGRDAIHHRLNERARREVLAGTGLDVLRVALQQALVGVARHVGAHGRPVFGADQVHDDAPQLGRILTISTGDWTPSGRSKGEHRER